MARQQAGSEVTDSVRDAVQSAVTGLGLLVEDVTVTPAGARRVLRVVLDADDDTAPTPSLDAVAEASREISAALDAGDVLGSAPYTLEVSSPGVDRPLTTRRHFARNVSRLVQVELADGSSVLGRVRAAGHELELEVAGARKGTFAQRSVGWDDVRRGRVQVEFRRPEAEDEAGDDAAPDDEDGE